MPTRRRSFQSCQIGGGEHKAILFARRLRHSLDELFPAEQARIVQLLVERVHVQEDALEVRITAEGLASVVTELRQHDERRAA